MLPPNIQQFNQIALIIFTQLYETFPDQIEIDPELEGYKAFPDERDGRKMWDRMTMASNTMSWLREEGFSAFQGGYMLKLGVFQGVHLHNDRLCI